MRRTLALAVLGLASFVAAITAFLLRDRPTPQAVDPRPSPRIVGPLTLSAQLDRRYLPDSADSQAYLELDIAAGAASRQRARVPVNAVLVFDRSGSMAGEKIEQARAAARALIDSLGGSDRVALVAFDTEAQVLIPSADATPALKEIARRAIDGLDAMGETNFSAAFAVAGPQLAAGRRAGRVDEVFIASDGRVTDGELDLRHLIAEARATFGGATLSTFGIGDDYDEELLNGLASAGGGRMQFIHSATDLRSAFASELGRATKLVGTQVRVRVRPLAGAQVVQTFGYEADEGWLRLPDFAAGDARRVLLRLAVSQGMGPTDLAAVELEYTDTDGQLRRAQTSVQATFTADATKLAEPPGPAAIEGARAEMAEVARRAVLDQETGNSARAAQRLQQLDVIANRVPNAAPQLRTEASAWVSGVTGAVTAGDARSKEVKQKVFDAVRAPVAGW